MFLNQEEKREKKKVNTWLTDHEWIEENIKYHDMNYVHLLCEKIWYYLIKTPVHIYVSYDPIRVKIYFSVSRNGNIIKVAYPIDENVVSYDFLVRLNSWLRQFFPQYTIERSNKRQITAEEIANKMTTDGVNFDEIYNDQVSFVDEEYGIIERVYIKEDSFEFNLNGETFLRMSRIPVSRFMQQLRKLNNNYDIRDFIENNSKTIVNQSQKDVYMNAEVYNNHDRLINFFEINMADYYDCSIVIDQESGLFRWGKFLLTFPDEDILDECSELIDIYRKERNGN